MTSLEVILYLMMLADNIIRIADIDTYILPSMIMSELMCRITPLRLEQASLSGVGLETVGHSHVMGVAVVELEH